jgi:hypothetical protein
MTYNTIFRYYCDLQSYLAPVLYTHHRINVNTTHHKFNNQHKYNTHTEFFICMTQFDYLNCPNLVRYYYYYISELLRKYICKQTSGVNLQIITPMFPIQGSARNISGSAINRAINV